MKKFAVIGNPIAHSLSPMIHSYFAQITAITLNYEKMLGDLEQFETQVKGFFNEGGSGLNVTLPFKLRAYEMAEQKSQAASQAQAANVLFMSEEGFLQADNTDGIGLVRDLSQYLDLKGKKILILGAGGAARGIIAPLLVEQLSSLTLGVRDKVKARHLGEIFPGVKIAAMAELKEPADIIIHATSANFSNRSQPLALPDNLWQGRPFCYDLSYCKEGNTPFVNLAKAQGCKAVDGLGMLIEQAAEAFWFWNGVVVPNEEKKALFSEIRGKSMSSERSTCSE